MDYKQSEVYVKEAKNKELQEMDRPSSCVGVDKVLTNYLPNLA